MRTNRTYFTPDRETITWDDENGDNGQIKIEYIGDGKYEFDADGLGLDKLYCIIKHVKSKCED